MGKVSRWEVAGIPAALVFEAAHQMGWLAEVGVTQEQLPSLMILVYCLIAGARALHTKKAKGGTGAH